MRHIDGHLRRAPITASGDNIAPSVAITSPANGAIVARKSWVAINATASDNVGVALR